MWKKLTEYVNKNLLHSIFLNLAFVIVIVTATDGNAKRAIDAIEAFAGVAIIVFVLGAKTFYINIFTGTAFKKSLWVKWWPWAKEWSVSFCLVYLNFWFLLKLVIIFF